MQLRDVLLRTGEPQHHKNMSVVPILSELSTPLDLLTLEEAQKSLKVSEVSAAGTVNTIHLENVADTKVLILGGEQLQGAKQNRILSKTIIIGARQELDIPVSCTEAGRWSYSTQAKDFSYVDNMASKGVRSVQASNYMRPSASYQGQVWAAVGIVQSSSNTFTSSPTQDLNATYNLHMPRISEYVDAFALAENQMGVLVFIDNHVVGVDALGSWELWNKLGKKLLKSYALDALSTYREELDGLPRADALPEFIDRVISATRTEDRETIGIEKRFLLSGDVNGALVNLDEDVAHVVAFPSNGSVSLEANVGTAEAHISKASTRKDQIGE